MQSDALSTPRLRAFVAVAEAGGFTRAARALDLSQSSLSQAVAALEEELGQPLFVRAGRSVQLTEAGGILLAHAERALSELSRAAALLDGLLDLTRGQLAVGTSDTLATYLLPPLFAAFRERHPAIELRLENRPSLSVAERVAQHELDLGLLSLPLPESHKLGRESARASVRVEPLLVQEDAVIAPPSFRRDGKRPFALDELAREPLVLLDRSTATRGLLDERFRTLGVRPRVVMEMSSVEVIKRLVERGFGLSVVPAMAAARELREGTLRSFELASPWPRREVGLITSARRPLSPAARAFVAALRAELPKPRRKRAEPQPKPRARSLAD